MDNRAKEMQEMKLSGATYQEIGDKFSISRQRVQQLISPPPYIRRIVETKAKGKCQGCGVFVGKSGHVHHLGGNGEDYNDIDNLKYLCSSCHMKKHMRTEVSREKQSRAILEARYQTYMATGKI